MALYFQANEKERSNKRILRQKKRHFGRHFCLFANFKCKRILVKNRIMPVFLSTALRRRAIYQTKTSGQFVRKVAKYGQTD